MDQYKLESFGSWELKRQLGLGGFGDVHLWRNVHTGREIATKRLRENCTLSADEIDKLQDRWQQEYKWMMMMRVKTPYIVHGLNDLDDPQFFAYLTERHAWRPLPPIIMEYCNGGDLRCYLEKVENVNGLHEFEVREVLHALRHAIEYLHTECRIEHRDLKPDNVVIHDVGKRRHYKLTDFGFARKITENTVLKSIVGTRNYVAPEVLDTAKYKNTVDYWSLGVIAFELICGCLPFIPNKSLFDIITNLRKKPENCIAITEDVDGNKFEFHSTIPAESHMSSVTLTKMEAWLHIAFDLNYQTRGTRPSASSPERHLTFYKELDAIFVSKVLTVFCLTTYKFYTWDVTADMSLSAWAELVQRDVSLLRDNLFCIFPTGHPQPTLSAGYQAMDFFVEKWQNTRDCSSPPAMLYIVGFACDYNLPEPQIPNILKKYMHTKKDIPDWLLKAIEKNTHFLLSNEQRHLEAYVSGLREYSLTVEQLIFEFTAKENANILQEFCNTVTDMNGRVIQFHMNIEAAKRVCPVENTIWYNFFAKWGAKANKFKEELETMQALKNRVMVRYQSVLRRARKLANSNIFDDIKKKDVFSLQTYRRHLESDVSGNDKERLEACRTAIYNCLEARRQILTDCELNGARDTIGSLHQEFRKVNNIVHKSCTKLNQTRITLEEDTMDFHAKMIAIYQCAANESGAADHTILAQDGVSPMFLNGNNESLPSIRELLEYPVEPLIQGVASMLNQMNIDEDQSRNNLPATIDP